MKSIENRSRKTGPVDLGGPLSVFFLRVAAFLYGCLIRFRLWLYRKGFLSMRRLPLKVISIGNLTAGGTGKTPHAALLARYLQRQGIKTAVLSRGYRGTQVKKGAVISDGKSIRGTLEAGGEEPFWLAKNLPGIPVVIGRDRFHSGMVCFQKWQTQWVVLDDGFQYLGLERDINILLWSGYFPFGSGNLLPLGFFREPFEEIRRADTIIITHVEGLNYSFRQGIVRAVRSIIPEVPVFFSEHQPMLLWRYGDKKEIPLVELAGRKIVAFCGLASPDSFLYSLKQLQIDPVKTVEFPDHHLYQEKDKKELEDLCRFLNINALITTEKDALKLGQWAPKDLEVLVLKIEVEIQEAAFWEWLDQRIKPEE